MDRKADCGTENGLKQMGGLKNTHQHNTIH